MNTKVLESPIQRKRCVACGVMRPVTAYRHCPTTRDRLNSYCQPCERDYSKAYYHRKSGELKRLRRENQELKHQVKELRDRLAALMRIR